MERFRNPSGDKIRALLGRVRSIAVVGLSPDRRRPSHGVARSMQGFGYRIIPVRPAIDSLLGERAYASLHELYADHPEGAGLVDVFRASEHVAPLVDECIDLRVPALWLQDGVIDEAAALRAQRAGITVVMNRCVYRDYLALVA